MARIFLSYSKRDHELAACVAEALRREGLTVWWDEEITPRDSWDRAIEREIASADHVLALWTRNSVESDWVRIEANYARNCRPSKLVQARFDQSEVPIAFSLIQFVELDRSRPERSAEWARLLSWLREPSTAAAPQSSFEAAPTRAEAGAATREASSMRAPKPWPLPFAPAGLSLLLGPIFYFTCYVITDTIRRNSSGDDLLLFGLTPAVYQTFTFGLPYILLRRMPMQDMLFFLFGIPAAHFLATQAGSAAAQLGLAPGSFEMTFLVGALGSAVGALLCFGGALALRNGLRDPYATRQAMIAIMSLPLIGGVGLFLARFLSAYEPWNWAALYLPWQFVLAVYLLKILEPVRAPDAASRPAETQPA
jgi:hypothetical protein